MKDTSARPDMPAANRPFILHSVKSENRERVKGPKEYRIEDVWGDDPSLTPCAANQNATDQPEPQPDVVSEPRQSWIERLLSLFQIPEIIIPDESLNYSPAGQLSSAAWLPRPVKRRLDPEY